MHLATINLNVMAAIIGHHPELNGNVEFETRFDTVSPFHVGFVTHVRIKDHRAYDAIFGQGRRERSLLNLLEHYRGHEPKDSIDFVIESLGFLIGDGDDTLAVTEVSSYEVMIWVRTFGPIG